MSTKVQLLVGLVTAAVLVASFFCLGLDESPQWDARREIKPIVRYKITDKSGNVTGYLIQEVKPCAN